MTANENLFDYKFKIAVVGDSSAGKSSLLKRFIEKEQFALNDSNNNQTAHTVGVDFKAQTVNLEQSNVNVLLNFYDTSGDEKYRFIAQSYINHTENVSAYLVAYDTKNMQSFNNCQYWLEEITKKHDCSYKPNRKCDHLIKILVGCKNDLEINKDKVSTKKAREFAKKNGFCLFYETSAKDNLNVKELFEELCMELMSNYLKFLSYQESLLNLISVPCLHKSFMLFQRSIPLKAITTRSDVYYNCATEKLNCNHIILNNKNAKRKSLQATKTNFDLLNLL